MQHEYEHTSTYLPTYQNQNVGHQAETMCMYTIDEQEISKIVDFQRLSSTREELYICKLIITCWRECCTELSGETCIVFSFFFFFFSVTFTITNCKWSVYPAVIWLHFLLVFWNKVYALVNIVRGVQIRRSNIICTFIYHHEKFKNNSLSYMKPVKFL